MKLLILTQKIDTNDSALGFFHQWIVKFAQKFDTVTAICLYQGKYNLPQNVKVLSLGKEDSLSKFRYVLNFYKYIWGERSNYDVVFVHMNSIYMLLGGLFWKILGKKTSLWYIHPKASISLRIATIFTDIIFSATKKSFPIRSNKLIAVGHGIDTDLFRRDNNTHVMGNSILYAGRITPVKNIDTIVRAVKKLHSEGVNLTLNIVGEKDYGHPNYYRQMREEAGELEKKGVINFLGALPSEKMPSVIAENEILVNATKSGSFDKITLEAMLSEKIVVTSNNAFINLIPERFVFEENNPDELAKILVDALNLSDIERSNYGIRMRDLAKDKSDLDRLIDTIKSHLSS